MMADADDDEDGDVVSGDRLLSLVDRPTLGWLGVGPVCGVVSWYEDRTLDECQLMKRLISNYSVLKLCCPLCSLGMSLVISPVVVGGKCGNCDDVAEDRTLEECQVMERLMLMFICWLRDHLYREDVRIWAGLLAVYGIFLCGAVLLGNLLNQLDLVHLQSKVMVLLSGCGR